MLYLTENRKYENLVDPSTFIPRFSNKLLKGAHNKQVVETATHIIASMKSNWMQIGRKPSGICGAALYTAALSHGGSDPPSFQRAEKERMEEKASTEENDKQQNSDESSTLSDLDDGELDCYFRNPKEVHLVEIIFDHENPGYDEKEAAALNACNNASNLFEASKAAAAKSRKDKRQQRAEEEKNAPPPATAMEAVDSMVKRKKFPDTNCDYLEELLDTSAQKASKRLKTETVMEKNKEEHEIVENEQDEEDYAA
ncbi:putative transcription factor TFIIB, brf1, TBP-binding domain, Cyclin-like superfamily [Arabidopsis thaliana]|uniref:Brf1 TBP-binding domain n=1 Tax=Arabidopsis thaliana x Arabidopsis arenosa TaxID=1240361 RepID=A0A8T2GKW0_9BRAS|nr:Brf1 TBP-binding domain [Arabidopsis thaliana x Arabidopsis arenosa]